MRLRAALMALCLAVVALPARAEPPPEVANPHLGRALEAIEAGDLGQALKALKDAMAYPENSNRILVEIYRTLAVVQYYRGQESRAYESFARLLNIDPRYALPPHTAAPLVQLFDRVKSAYAKGLLKPVRIAHEPVDRVSSEVPIPVTATVSNLQPGFAVRVHFRPAGTETYASVDMQARPGNRFVATLPPMTVDRGESRRRVDYYLEVADDEGRRVQGVGSALEPLSFNVSAPVAPAPPPKAEWYQNPWIWVGVGAVAAGATAAVIVTAGGPDTGTLPVTVRLP